MSSMSSVDVLRPDRSGVAGKIMQWGLGHAGVLFGLLRAVWPIPHVRRTYVVTRYDDVREVFLADADFPVPYQAKLDVIMGGEPFFLGMNDGPAYRRDTDAMRMAMRREDVSTRLAPAATALAGKIVNEAGGSLEVVDALSRRVTFEVLCDYFGVDDTPNRDLRVWATRLFEFQFADGGNDPSLRQEVDQMAPALRAHIDALIARRRQTSESRDDVLGRCLAFQAEGRPGFSDTQIRCALIGFIVGGLPQPPMVVPQALEQLLRRPDALAGAQRAAREHDDVLLGGYIFEALRFDPLAPALLRTVARDHVVAEGTRRATKIPSGASMAVAFSSAMMDERRVPDPRRFNPRRLPHEYMHFGHGLHTCFGIHINHALVPLMLKPLLQRDGLRRADGALGHLKKRGAFADRLWVRYSQVGS
jgi:cytochrome P450